MEEKSKGVLMVLGRPVRALWSSSIEGRKNENLQWLSRCSRAGLVALGVIPAVAQDVDQFVYATTDKGHITGYRMDGASGQLTALKQDPLAASEGSVAVEPANRFVFTTQRDAHGVWSFQIDASSGFLTPTPHSPLHFTSDFTGLVATQTHVYLADPLYAVIRVLSIDQGTGDLAVVGPAVAAGTVFRLALHPSGSYLYAALPFPTDAGAMLTYSVDPGTGLLTKNGPPVQAPPGAHPLNAVVEPSGQYLYAALSTGKSVAAYRIGPNGRLSEIGIFAADRNTIDVAVSPSGQSAYALNAGPPNITGYAVDSSGGLAELTGSPYAAGISHFPSSIVIDPSGQFLYVANDGVFYGYLIDAKTGRLTVLEGSPFLATEAPTALTITRFQP